MKTWSCSIGEMTVIDGTMNVCGYPETRWQDTVTLRLQKLGSMKAVESTVVKVKRQKSEYYDLAKFVVGLD